MWSGPRNISTALMRSWENRGDTVVIDEPFYAYFLQQTGRQHPGRAEVLAAQPKDWPAVVASLQAPLADGVSVQYQKQMTHHIDESVDLGWLAGVQNCFLIREPRNMLASLLKVVPDATLNDTGLPQQLRLFDYVRRHQDVVPPVIDSADVLRNPAGMLAALCQSLGVLYSDSMLSWLAGPRDSDGVWAPYWYDAVVKSTGFSAWHPATPDIPEEKCEILKQCDALYAQMAPHCLKSTDGAN